ncbi:SurA N-terminal domain-containing protein [Phenylobacterium sp. LjRoot225]|uniref:peptidylprolyl isomerase n=1 Tax=Phenylobacterium sp. LjRoot225 TaxID=3342285 RepID=UPI003ECD2718
MLTAFRTFAKSWVAAVLIGLLVVAFAVFGLDDIFEKNVSNSVVVAGSRKVSPTDFRREFDQMRKRAEQEMGQPITAEVAAANGLDRQVLQGVATREAFAELLHKIGVRPSDKEVVEQIAKIPAFFDSVSGRFDKEQYEQRLAQNDMTVAGFEGMLRDEMAQQHLVAALTNSLQIPRAYSAMAAIYALENRDVAYLTVGPASVPQPAAPTDAQLTAFMKENAAQLTLPEFRVLTLVRFSPLMVGANLAVDEAELKKRYDFRKDTLSTPETRSLVQIPAKDAPAAQAISARLQRGEDPAAVAKAVGVDAIAYEGKPQSAIADHKVAAAAFKLQPGQVSMVQGDLGLAVVKITGVTPGKTVSFEEARPALEAELRKDAASEKVYALTEAYSDAHQKGANLTEAAEKAGVAATTIGPVSKDGRDQQGQPVGGLTQKLMDTAFSLPSGGESEVVEAGNGEYFAVRVEKVVPPAMPPLAAIKPQLTQAWMMREVGKAMQAKAEALAARVRKGESLEAVAASSGAKLTRVPGVDRRTGPQNPLMSQEILGAVFGGKPGEVFTARGRGFDMAVGKVEATHVGDPAQLAQLTEQARPQMTQTIFREIGQSAQGAARQTLKTKVDYNLARTAIGLEPLTTKDTTAKGKTEPAK